MVKIRIECDGKIQEYEGSAVVAHIKDIKDPDVGEDGSAMIFMGHGYPPRILLHTAASLGSLAISACDNDRITAAMLAALMGKKLVEAAAGESEDIRVVKEINKTKKVTEEEEEEA